jgi:asparagine synthase (glutamine-hydrolysing)
MSGIVGLIRWDGVTTSPGIIREMAKNICHRGPDGITFLDQETFSGGYLHLNVTRESGLESQPLINAQGNVLVADARIDNRQELCNLLNIHADEEGKLLSDSRLILLAYEKWETDCLNYLIGDFAFAIWDPSTQTIFCGRDHSGVRPLFYHYVPGKYFLFASEIKAFWAFGEVEKKIDDHHLANYLCHWGQFNIYQHRTFYKGISSLPPAHSLTANSQQIHKEMYWNIDSKRYQFRNEEEYFSAFKEIFLEAVRCRIQTPYSVSSFLSGGLDSSSVAAVATTLLQAEGKKLSTYYIDTQLEETSEREYVQSFLEKYSVQHEEVTVEGGYYDNLTEVAKITDMPEMFSLNYNHFAPIVRKASEAGSRVLLTGSDGDTVVGYGTEYIYEAIARDDWKEAARRMRLSHDPEEYRKAYGSQEGERIYSKNMVTVLLTRLPTMFGNIRAKWHFLKGTLIYLGISPIQLVRIFSEKFSRKALEIPDYSVHPDLPGKCTPFMQEGPGHHPTTNLLINRGMLYQMMTEISEYYDLMGAHHQVQICHPFYDKRLIELCMFMPSKLKFYEGYGRGPLRAAMKDYLPDKILYRKGKIDFTTYIHKQLTDLDRNPFAVIEENKALLEGYVIVNKPSEELLAKDKKTTWERLHHRILYFLHWRKAQGI